MADEELKVLKKYKVWKKKKFMGREFMGVVRTTYLIDKKGYSREEAYKIVQECAHNHEYFKSSFIDRKILTDAEIREIFNPKMYQQNIDYIFRRVVERE